MSTLKGIKINGGFPFDFGAEVDDTLTVEGAPADAKATGDALSDLSSAIGQGSVSTEMAEALDALLVKAGYIDSNAQGEYEVFRATWGLDNVTIYDIGWTGTNYSATNHPSTVVEGSTFTTTISADTGYVLNTVTCTMNGVAQSVTNGVINIANVTGDIIITVTTTVDSSYRTITYNLSNVSSSNNVTTIADGDPYVSTISANEDYILGSVSVTMGGIDITSTVYSNGTITISSVTGDLVISANGTAATIYPVSEEMCVSLNKAQMFSDEGETSYTGGGLFSAIYISINESSDKNITFRIKKVGTAYSTARIGMIVDSTKGSIGGAGTNNAHSYGASANTLIYNVESMNNYYLEGSGDTYTYDGNVYGGVVNVPAGCSIIIGWGSPGKDGNNLGTDLENTFFKG